MTIVQVGGTHYKSEYQHWDWVEDSGMGYLEANATRYLTRWRKKNGLDDLRKAHTYVFKLIVRHQEFGRRNNARFVGLQRFVDENRIQPVDAALCALILCWRDVESLYMALAGINELIASSYPETLESHVNGKVEEWNNDTKPQPDEDFPPLHVSSQE